MTEQDNFIEVYKNVYSNDFCNEVIKFYDYVENQKLTYDRSHEGVEQSLHKSDKTFFYPQNFYKLSNADPLINNTFLDIFWNKCYKEYANKYSIIKDCASHRIYGARIQKTKPGEGYHTWHCEATDRESATRLLVWSVYLNDDFEAGETEFLYQHYRYKPQKGDCIIFPAAFTHTHRGNPPIGGDKYIITGWVEF